MSKIRYRRDIKPITLSCVYTEEVWEEFTYSVASGDGFKTGLRLIAVGEQYTYPLEGWELTAAKAGWTEPDEFTYHDKLPVRSDG